MKLHQEITYSLSLTRSEKEHLIATNNVIPDWLLEYARQLAITLESPQ